MNIHTPARQPNESQADYRARRAASNRANVQPSGGRQTSRELQREERRKNGHLRGTYGQGLRNHFNRKRVEAQKGVPRDPARLKQIDKHGFYTVTGATRMVIESPFPARMERRKWLAGISAQRGY